MSPTLQVVMARPVRRNWWDRKLTLPRMGVLLHYDASASDKGAVAWLEDDARARVSYNWIVLDDGTVIELTREAAWHAGVCKTSDPARLPYIDANQQLYGVAIAARDGERVTPAALASVLRVCAYLFWLHDWKATETWRIVGHDTEAWERGRKADPTGDRSQRPDNPYRHLPPVLSVAEVREQFTLSAFGGVP